jgi:hypothetical protein
MPTPRQKFEQALTTYLRETAEADGLVVERVIIGDLRVDGTKDGKPVMTVYKFNGKTELVGRVYAK